MTFQKSYSNKFSLVLILSLSAFVVYSSMYGFRKPFTAGNYTELPVFGISYKVWLIIAQVIGYMISKFLGIRIISGLLPKHRVPYLIGCISIAWFSLFLFGIIPAPLNIICLFLNGLPLGMVFGLVFGYLEGRKTTEIIGAFLATSFVFASGLAKTIGKWLMVNLHVASSWMPFVAGLFFIIPFLVALWFLHHAPPPSEVDNEARSIRLPMNEEERVSFLQLFGTTLVPAVIGYTIFTIIRDFTEDFSNELWNETGFKDDAGIFFFFGSIISIIVLIIIGSFFLIRSNKKAFVYTHILIIAGLSITLVITIFFHYQIVNVFYWMLIATTGLYLAYLPFNCLYFERFISVYRIKGNVGFVMYIADAFGYLGTVFVLIVKEFIQIEYSWVVFFKTLFIGAAIIGSLLIAYALWLHQRKLKSLSINI